MKIDIINGPLDYGEILQADILTIKCSPLEGDPGLIGDFHTKKLSELIKVLIEKNSNKEKIPLIINLNIAPSTEEIDTAFIGLLIFAKYKVKSLKIKINLNKKSTKSYYKIRGLFFALETWAAHIINSEIYELYDDNQLIYSPESLPKDIFPALIINSETFTKFFVSNSELREIRKKINSTLNNEEYYAKIQNTIRENSTNPKETISQRKKKILWKFISDNPNFFNLTKLEEKYIEQYINILAQFDIIFEKNFMNKNSIKAHRFSYLSAAEMMEIREEVRKIAEQIENEPPFFMIVFAFLILRGIERKKGNIRYLKNKLTNTYNLTRNIFQGTKEIAKNIIEHTESGTGILLIRLYRKEQIEKLRKKYDYSAVNSNPKYMDLVIYDEGDEGIIPRTKKTLNDAIKSQTEQSELFKKDLEQIDSKSFKLANFYSADEFKLNFNAIKAMAHWGLGIFANIIRTNNGFFTVSTRKEGINTSYEKFICNFNEKDNYSTNHNENFVLGTYYNIIIPLKKLAKTDQKVFGGFIPKNSEFSAQKYIDLLGYKIVDSVEKINQFGPTYILNFRIIGLVDNNSSVINKEREKLIVEKILLQTSSLDGQNLHDKIIICLDFDLCEGWLDQSSLVRIIGSLQMSMDIKSMIVVNVKADVAQDLSNTLEARYSQKSVTFWNPGYYIIIYSYEQSEGKRDYFSEILGGETTDDWRYLRRRLALSHKTKDKIESFYGKVTPEEKKKLQDTKIITNLADAYRKSFLNFELILQHNRRYLYEYSIDFVLDKDIILKPQSKNNQNLENDYGYRIRDSHFRLGSKIHITDFIYAKRIFQIGYYASKFAFRVSQYILELITTDRNKFSTNLSLTLIGYAEYSHMLLNRVEKILNNKQIKERYGITEVNYDILSDVSSLLFVRNEKLNDNIIILVPINTTFSTNNKIENEIYRKIKREESNSDGGVRECKIIQPHINIILVSHKDLMNDEYVQNLNQYLKKDQDNESDDKEYPYKMFDWSSVDKRNQIVKIKQLRFRTPLAKKEDRFRYQKYFITVKSEWYMPDKCESCFPHTTDPVRKSEIMLFEKPLLETDKTSLTPSLLLELPRPYLRSKAPTEKIWINEEAHVYGHYELGGYHYLHFLNANNFFTNHLHQIREWARKIAVLLKGKIEELDEKQILLISPSDRNNTYFLDFINKEIFHDNAQIIHYEVLGDYIENYQKFFEKIIVNTDLVFYVDDIVKSGKTFNIVNNFIKFCKKKQENTKSNGCNGIFSLISKTENYNKQDIESKADNNFFVFYELFSYNFSKSECPLCMEKLRYEKLAEYSILDSIKYYFLNKANKLKVSAQLKHERKNGWERFHPLVREDALECFPWKVDTSNQANEYYTKIKDYYNYYCVSEESNRFPGKHYLKILIEHELNNILSNNFAIRDKISLPYINVYRDENNDNLLEELFDEIFELILKSNPFSIWLNNPNANIRRILRRVIKTQLIKIFTLQPFANIKPVREKVFSWILLKLNRQLNKLVDSAELNFRDLRYLKFLMRRATMLGSNFIIRSVTFSKFREIFKQFTPEMQNDYLEKRKKKYSKINEEINNIDSEIKVIKGTNVNKNVHLESQNNSRIVKRDSRRDSGQPSKKKTIRNIKESLQASIIFDNTPTEFVDTEKLEELQKRRRYCIQLLKNLEYKNDSIQDFIYFYVSLVKELIYENESKILVIEKNIEGVLSIISDTDKRREKDFLLLLTFIKYENAIIYKKAIRIIVDDYMRGLKISFETRFSSKGVREAISKSFINGLLDPRLAVFKKLIYGQLKFNNNKLILGSSDISIIYLRLCYLFYIIKNDLDEKGETTVTSALGDKTKTIVQNFFRISCDPNFDRHTITNKSIDYKDDSKSGAFIVLSSRASKKKITPEDMFLAYATSTEGNNRSNSLNKMAIDDESLTYFMMNGICGIHKMTDDYKKEKPLTILALREANDQFCSMYDALNIIADKSQIIHKEFKKIYSSGVLTNQFTERIYIEGEFVNFGMLRISKMIQSVDSISNGCFAVLAFYNNECNDFDTNKLRMALILNSEIQKFVEKHYEADSVVAFINERNKVNEFYRLRHSFEFYLEDLYRLAISPDSIITNRTKFSDILYNLIIVGPVFQNIIGKMEEIRNVAAAHIKSGYKKKYRGFNKLDLRIQERLMIKDLKISEIMELVEDLSEAIYNNNLARTVKWQHFKPHISNNLSPQQNEVQIEVSSILLTSIFVEVLLNAKKYSKEDSEIHLHYSYDNKQKCLWLTVKNSPELGISDTEKRKLKKNTILNNLGGIALVKRLSYVLTGIFPIVDPCETSELYSISIPIRGIK